MNVTRKRRRTKRYTERAMWVTVKTFGRCKNKLPGKLMDRNGIVYKMWIDPALFSAMRYTDDAKLLPGDTTSEAEWLTNQGITRYSS